jgi:hypothetical protein
MSVYYSSRYTGNSSSIDPAVIDFTDLVELLEAVAQRVSLPLEGVKKAADDDPSHRAHGDDGQKFQTGPDCTLAGIARLQRAQAKATTAVKPKAYRRG